MQKSTLVDDMLRGLATLPLTSLKAFQSDARDVAAAESFLRRALEALLDLGRHVLAKGLGERALEYKQIVLALRRAGVLDEACSDILLDMAGYRNRLTHFYDEVTAAELFDICAHPQRRDPAGARRNAKLAAPAPGAGRWRALTI